MILPDSQAIQNVSYYIDAGLISILVQFLIGAFLTGLIMLKVFWAKVKSYFQKDIEGK